VSLHFFADQCVPSEISDWLSHEGHQVTLLRQVLPIRSPDNLVIAKAQELKSVLLSLNGDFSDIVTYPPENYGGIIAIQLNDHPEIIPQLMAGLTRFLTDHPDESFYAGKLFIVEVHRIRIRA
jgi:predicted nuclease of predicted toxin-antitoxin system